MAPLHRVRVVDPLLPLNVSVVAGASMDSDRSLVWPAVVVRGNCMPPVIELDNDPTVSAEVMLIFVIVVWNV